MSYTDYSDLKETGILWIGEIPTKWKIDRFKWTVTGCINGIWGDEPTGVDDIVCIRVADFDRQKNRLSDGEYTFRSVDQKARENRALKRGDLLIEKSGGGELQPVGTVILFDQDFDAVCSNFVARMPVRAEHDSRYLCYLHLVAYHARINTRSIKQNTGIQNLDSTAYLDEKTCLPSLPEQTTIANFLDHETAKIDTLIAKQQRLIELLQEKRQALISHAVTKGLNPDAPMKDSGVEWLGEVPAHWRITRLKHATSHTVDCPHATPIYSDDGMYPVIRTADVSLGVLDLRNTFKLELEEYLKRIIRLKPIKDDILYSREGERYGMAALVPENVELCLGQRMMHFRPNSSFSSSFLMWQLNSNAVYNQAKQDSIGATSPHVNVETIRNYWLTEPPIEEQTEIVKFIDAEISKIDRITLLTQSAIEVSQERRSSLISAAVTGKIDVRGYNTTPESSYEPET